ncbi:MAG: hypothetical protein E7384_08020 [Ruminococcaceae bacterium]|nr:hypothetical protein [Oscillospiraceae bacterium]
MKLLRVQCKHIKGAKTFLVSQRNIFFLTGKRLIVLDKSLNLVTEVAGFDYAYDAYLSPDESKLLIVPSGNKFYIVTLDDYKVSKVLVKDGYNDNLDGRGCWSFDGKSVYIPAVSPKTILSDMRKYSVTEIDKYESLLCGKYWITQIRAIPELKKYLLTGYDRNTLLDYFIWYDEKKFVSYEIKGFDDHILNIDVDTEHSVISLFSFDKCETYSFEGEKISDLKFRPETCKCNFFDVFKDIPEITDEGKKELEALITELGMNDISVTEDIHSTCLKPNSKLLFLCTSMGIVIVDSTSYDVIKRVNIEYGVNKIYFLEDDMFLAECFNSVKFFKIIE